MRVRELGEEGAEKEKDQNAVGSPASETESLCFTLLAACVRPNCWCFSEAYSPVCSVISRLPFSVDTEWRQKVQLTPLKTTLSRRQSAGTSALCKASRHFTLDCRGSFWSNTVEWWLPPSDGCTQLKSEVKPLGIGPKNLTSLCSKIEQTI